MSTSWGNLTSNLLPNWPPMTAAWMGVRLWGPPWDRPLVTQKIKCSTLLSGPFSAARYRGEAPALFTRNEIWGPALNNSKTTRSWHLVAASCRAVFSSAFLFVTISSTTPSFFLMSLAMSMMPLTKTGHPFLAAICSAVSPLAFCWSRRAGQCLLISTANLKFPDLTAMCRAVSFLGVDPKSRFSFFFAIWWRSLTLPDLAILSKVASMNWLGSVSLSWVVEKKSSFAFCRAEEEDWKESCKKQHKEEDWETEREENRMRH